MKKTLYRVAARLEITSLANVAQYYQSKTNARLTVSEIVRKAIIDLSSALVQTKKVDDCKTVQDAVEILKTMSGKIESQTLPSDTCHAISIAVSDKELLSELEEAEKE